MSTIQRCVIMQIEPCWLKQFSLAIRCKKTANSTAKHVPTWNRRFRIHIALPEFICLMTRSPPPRMLLYSTFSFNFSTNSLDNRPGHQRSPPPSQHKAPKVLCHCESLPPPPIYLLDFHILRHPPITFCRWKRKEKMIKKKEKKRDARGFVKKHYLRQPRREKKSKTVENMK
jgi:hypothetical protein